MGEEQARRKRRLVQSFRRCPDLWRRQGRRGQGRPRRSQSGRRLQLSGGPHHRDLRGADLGHPDGLARPFGLLHAARPRHEYVQRLDAAKRLALADSVLSGTGSRLPGDRLRLRRLVQPRRQRLDRQPQFRDSGCARRQRRQRDRRRPGFSHLRLFDERPIRRGLQPGLDRLGYPVRLGRRWLLADLLQGHGDRLLADPELARARLEHPDAMAANPLLRRRVERRAAQVHPLRRQRDRERPDHDGNAAIFDPPSGPDLDGIRDSGLDHGCRGRKLRFGRRRGLRRNRRPLRLHWCGGSDCRRRVRDEPERDLSFLLCR